MAILGLNLNNFSLNNLPTLTPTELQQIADRIQAARAGAPSALGVFQNTSLIGISPNFRNPESYQFGGGVEHEWKKNIFIGLDASWVKTIHLQRNVDINVPAPLTPDQYVAYLQSVNSAANFNALVTATNNFAAIRATGRPIIAIVAPTSIPTNISGARVTRSRPVSSLASIQLRDSSANSLYRSITGRLRIIRPWVQMNAFYTWSKSESDDDNERDSGGVLYDDPFTRRGEYYASRLDRTHQFVANPIFYLKWGFEVASAIRLRSGTPINPIVGSDLNGDGNTNERPYINPGLELPRNYYRNRPIYDVDVRLQRAFRFSERGRFVLSAEVFNILNRANIQIFQNNSNSSVQYCSSTTDVTCGLAGITGFNFLQIRERRPGNAAFGKVILNNNPGSQAFQVQLGGRLYF